MNKGKQSFLLETKKYTLDSLLKVAKIQSTSSSNKIEGIYTADKRISEIVNQKININKIKVCLMTYFFMKNKNDI